MEKSLTEISAEIIPEILNKIPDFNSYPIICCANIRAQCQAYICKDKVDLSIKKICNNNSEDYEEDYEDYK